MAEYIEREKAIEDVQAWATNLNNPKMLVREDAICILQNIPAADVAPVRRGRWIKKVEIDGGVKREYFVCSQCEQTRMLTFHNFCPNCGAKMEES